jgi:hypothetical protein
MAWLLDCDHKRERKGKKLTRLRCSFPSSKESSLFASYYLRGPVFQKTSNSFFLEPSIPYTSEALKKENVKENLGKARLSIRQFSPFNFLFSIE